MKISKVLQILLTRTNIVSQAPIYERYDKNVQGNTVHERGKVAASITVPFRDFAELPDDKSKIGVAIATGGNPNLAKISARAATKSALTESIIKLACVGAVPLGATDCLNFGNPEKLEQMGEFVEGIEGLKEACEALEVPIVSGNVSLYNETRGKSIPPSALISVFGRVDAVDTVPQLFFQKEGETIFLIGGRSSNLGGSEFLKVCNKEDSRIPEVDLQVVKRWSDALRKGARKEVLSVAHPVSSGGVLVALAKACMGENLGVDIKIPEENIPQFLFSEDLGVVVTSDVPEKVRKIFGEEALELGQVVRSSVLSVQAGGGSILEQDLSEVQDVWENRLREII